MSPSVLPLVVFLTPYPLHRLIVEEEDEDCYEPRPEWAKASEHCVCWWREVARNVVYPRNHLVMLSVCLISCSHAVTCYSLLPIRPPAGGTVHSSVSSVRVRAHWRRCGTYVCFVMCRQVHNMHCSILNCSQVSLVRCTKPI